MAGAARADAVAFWRGRRVLLTGHTGFKGGWLATWLSELGARVHGFALDPPTTPSFFAEANVAAGLASDTRGDVRDADAVAACVRAARPEIILHMAAQSLVRRSHAEPLLTVVTNVMGTAHVLEAGIRSGGVRAIVIVTSDKCYENRERPQPYRESDALGGDDPYSASKACAEILTGAWRTSFAAGAEAPRIASARAGNVIGTGDWAPDRLVPDCLSAFSQGRAVRLRHPESIRPWQHVLDPLAGYLRLARTLCSPEGPGLCEGWNFGPDPDSGVSTLAVATELARLWGSGARVEVEADRERLLEAGVLRLDSTAARERLGWRPRWNLDRALGLTVSGHQRHAGGETLDRIARSHVLAHEAAVDEASGTTPS